VDTVIEPLNSFEKHIYNTFLKVSRQQQNLPYQLRKNFEDIDRSLYGIIKKIGYILSKHDNILVNDYFIAPYKVYSTQDKQYFNLEFYISQRALKAYSIYIKQLETASLDSIEMLTRIKDSLVFLKTYCTENSLSYNEYLKTFTGQLPIFIYHIKTHKIVPHVMFGDDNLENIIKSFDSSMLKFMFGEDFYNNIEKWRTGFYVSKKCKLLIREGLKKLKKSLDF
jgi:hypothetical protein